MNHSSDHHRTGLLRLVHATLGTAILLGATLLGTAGAQLGDEGPPSSFDPGESSFEEPPGPAGETPGENAEQDVERFQDWGVRCGTVGDGSERACEMFQVVTREDSGQPVMMVLVGYPQGQDQLVAVFQLPLGIRLPPGVALSVDGSDPVRFPIQLCIEQGCRADLPLEDSLVQQMRAGTQAVLSVGDPRGQRLDLPISLSGFTAALQRLSEER